MIVKRSITLLAGGTALTLAALSLAACGGSGNNARGSSKPPGAVSSTAGTVDVASTSLGNVLVDSQGRTLYLFTKDSGPMSSCSGACAVNWPPLHKGGKPTAGNGAQASLVSKTASGGKSQVTYNGHPLYYFKGDSSPGDTNGQGLNAFGGSWYVVSSDGTQITTAPASSGGGGGGY